MDVLKQTQINEEVEERDLQEMKFEELRKDVSATGSALRVDRTDFRAHRSEALLGAGRHPAMILLSYSNIILYASLYILYLFIMFI